MTIKLLIVVFIIAILYSLGSSLVFLVRDHGEGDRTVKRLTWRIGLSLVLFLMIWAAYGLGWVEPNKGPVGLQVMEQESGTD
jgi:hypothetical protein